MAKARTRRITGVVFGVGAVLLVVSLGVLMWPLTAAGQDCGSALSAKEITATNFEGVREKGAVREARASCAAAKEDAEQIGFSLMVGGAVVSFLAYFGMQFTEPMLNGADFWRSRRWMRDPPDVPSAPGGLGQDRRGP
jgi:hypothetical protein